MWAQQGIQIWTVPYAWTYRISAAWAWRNPPWWSNPTEWGAWALIEWNVELEAWQKIKILVWQQWYPWSSSTPAWHGWSFVATINNEPIIVAGWGWAWYQDNNWWQSCWRTTENWWNWYNPWYWTAAWWTWWQWWASQSSNSQWWAWFYWNWNGGSTVALSFVNGWVWWTWNTWWWFGWWAWQTSWWWAGWGWYSGWGWVYNGSNWWNYWDWGWGWSYNIWTNKIEESCFNYWHWSVNITLITKKELQKTPASTWAWWWNLWYGWYGWSTTGTWKVWNNELWNTRWWDGWCALGWSGSNWHGWWGWVGCSGWGWWTGWNSDTNPYRLGSGWWAGWFILNDFNTGYGWNGWGMIRISTNILELNGKLLANWQAWKNYKALNSINYWAGWWWAGWSILIRAKALNCNTGNSIEVKWWAGWAWASWNNGWGWWWWWVVTYYYTDKEWTCAWILTKGSAWNSGWWEAWQDWLSYESAWTTFDTLRSRVIVEDSPAEANWTNEIKIRAYFLDVNWVPLEWEYLVAEVLWDLWTGKINWWNPLPQTDANGMITFPITSTIKWIKKVILKNAVTYTELQEQPTITFWIPSISINKIADKSTVNSWDVVTYTITVTNSGTWDAGWDVENSIIVEDVLPTWFRYYTTWPTAWSKWDTWTWTTKYYIFPETSWDGTSWNEERLRYTITDGISWPSNIPSNWWQVRIIFDVKVP